jgi:prepilin-type N-terminal cleavage/methylation domain-containing protein
MRASRHGQSAFTLIELLVVFSIISLVSSVLLVTTRTVRERARESRIATDLKNIMTQIDIARSDRGLHMFEITGQVCSMCFFSEVVPVSQQTGEVALMAASWKTLGFPASPVDPWGRPYLMDENEMEPFYLPNCYWDQLYSAGSDGIFESRSFDSGAGGGGGIVRGTGDDYVANVPYSTCH